jgi:hypothetical protein
MTAVLAEEAARIHRSARLSGALIAEAAGAKPSTVRDWFNAHSSPTGDELAGSELVDIPDRLGVWWRPATSGLAGQTGGGPR